MGEPAERLGVTALAHLIVFLSAVKLLQVKKDRDWVFLYLISFFEVLLAAGLSFSPVFLGTLTLYLLCGLSAVTAFEIQKARRSHRLHRDAFAGASRFARFQKVRTSFVAHH